MTDGARDALFLARLCGAAVADAATVCLHLVSNAHRDASAMHSTGLLRSWLWP